MYNVKIKVLNGNRKNQVVIREYKQYLGYEKESIDDYNLKRKMNDSTINYNDGLYKAILEEKRKKDIDFIVVKNEKNREIRKDNIIRSRNKVFDLAYVNENRWKSFVTLTFKEDITDVDVAFKRLNVWIKQVRRYCKKKCNFDFSYLGVIEFQDKNRNGVIHYHLLTNLECGKDLIPIQEGKENMYDVRYWNYGFSSAFDIIKSTNTSFDVAKYMCKYMTKKNDDIRLKGKRRYYHSRNLNKPIEKKLLKNSIEYQTIMYFIKHNRNYKLINYYHHIPLETYEIEYYHSEYQGENNSNELNIVDIIDTVLEF